MPKTSKTARKTTQRSVTPPPVAPVAPPPVPPMNLTFNRIPLTFDASVVEEKIKARSAVKPPQPATGKHSVSLPGVAYPVSLSWAIKALTGVDPQGFSANGLLKGSYHPQQAMQFLSKLSPYGVAVKTTSDNPRYAPFGENAKAALEAMRAAQQNAQQGAAQQNAPVAPVEVLPNMEQVKAFLEAHGLTLVKGKAQRKTTSKTTSKAQRSKTTRSK